MGLVERWYSASAEAGCVLNFGLVLGFRATPRAGLTATVLQVHVYVRVRVRMAAVKVVTAMRVCVWQSSRYVGVWWALALSGRSG
jgi:hypothetical protein